MFLISIFKEELCEYKGGVNNKKSAIIYEA